LARTRSAWRVAGRRGRGAAGRPGDPQPDAGGTEALPAELAALLGQISALRTTLATDLTLAAGAVEAGAAELAAGLLAADQGELALARQRLLSALEPSRPLPRHVLPRPVPSRPVPTRPRVASARHRGGSLLAGSALLVAVGSGVAVAVAAGPVHHPVPAAGALARARADLTGLTRGIAGHEQPRALATRADRLRRELGVALPSARHDAGTAQLLTALVIGEERALRGQSSPLLGRQLLAAHELLTGLVRSAGPAAAAAVAAASTAAASASPSAAPSTAPSTAPLTAPTPSRPAGAAPTAVPPPS
jgi:hypothetical protein